MNRKLQASSTGLAGPIGSRSAVGHLALGLIAVFVSGTAVGATQSPDAAKSSKTVWKKTNSATSQARNPATTPESRQPHGTVSKTAKPKTAAVTSPLAAGAAANASEAPENKPAEFIAARTQKVMTALKRRPLQIVDPSHVQQTIETAAGKSAWIAALYGKKLIEASWATEMLSDKRILAEVFEREIGESARVFYPKTVGLREFLAKHQLVDKKGKITASGDQIEEALFVEFPAGFIVRPAVGVAPQERGQGIYPDSDLFVVDLLKENSPLYSPIHMRRAVKSHILDAIASGEAIVLQEDIMRVADAKKPLKNHFFQEVRVHTYENRVVEGAVPSRWVQTNLLSPQQIQAAEVRVGELLKSLPLEFLNRQAWGVDVAVMDNGEMRVIDIVTNRGQDIPWSGYLDQPRVIGAYSRHFETYYGIRFEGWSGTLIRNNFANYMPFWEKKIEKAKPGWKKAVAFLPPVP